MTSVVLKRGPSSLPGIPKRTDGRKNALCTASEQRVQDRGFKVSGKASGCASGWTTRLRSAPVSRGRENGDQDNSHIEVVPTEWNESYVMTLTVDGGKKSAGTNVVRPVTRARSMADACAAGNGHTGVDDEADSDDREEALGEPTVRVAQSPRGPRAGGLASHLPSHELAVVSAIDTGLRPRTREWCWWSILTTAMLHQGENVTRRARLFGAEKAVGVELKVIGPVVIAH